MALYEAAKRLARQLGVDLAHESSGGGSDANFTGKLDIASLDGLGVCGAGAHTLQEHIMVDSLAAAGEAVHWAADGVEVRGQVSHSIGSDAEYGRPNLARCCSNALSPVASGRSSSATQAQDSRVISSNHSTTRHCDESA